MPTIMRNGHSGTIIQNGIAYGGKYDGSAELNSMKDMYDSLVMRTVTDINYGGVDYIGSYAFQLCNNLMNVSFPNVTNIGGGAFQQCNNLMNVSFPNVTNIGGGAFQLCNNLMNVSFPNVTNIGGYAFQLCNNLEVMEIVSKTNFKEQVFNSSTNFSTLVLSNNNLSTIFSNTFYGCPFNNGTATLYVPNALINDYLSAPNWSTILAYPNVNIMPIEGSIYE